MNKAELISKIAKKSDLKQNEVASVIAAFCEVVGKAMEQGDSIRILDFGTFGVSKRAARTARNLHTGESIEIPVHNVPSFKPSAALKEKANSSK